MRVCLEVDALLDDAHDAEGAEHAEDVDTVPAHEGAEHGGADDDEVEPVGKRPHEVPHEVCREIPEQLRRKQRREDVLNHRKRPGAGALVGGVELRVERATEEGRDYERRDAKARVGVVEFAAQPQLNESWAITRMVVDLLEADLVRVKGLGFRV